MAARTTDRARRLGLELIDVHDHLRQTVSDLRGAVLDGSELPAAGLRTLREHCLGFCSALTSHHTSEDTKVFPLLAAQVPELRDVLRELSHDHRLIGDILRRVEELAVGLTESNRTHVGAELEGLEAVLESHFRWEERRLAETLDALDDADYRAADLYGVDVGAPD